MFWPFNIKAKREAAEREQRAKEALLADARQAHLERLARQTRQAFQALAANQDKRATERANAKKTLFGSASAGPAPGARRRDDPATPAYDNVPFILGAQHHSTDNTHYSAPSPSPCPSPSYDSGSSYSSNCDSGSSSSDSGSCGSCD